MFPPPTFRTASRPVVTSAPRAEPTVPVTVGGWVGPYVQPLLPPPSLKGLAPCALLSDAHRDLCPSRLQMPLCGKEGGRQVSDR